MAVLNKLRNSTWVLILVLVSLLLFVISDYFSSSSNMGFGGAQNVGEIAGNNISLIEYDSRYKNLLAQLTSGGNPENDQTREQAATYAWNQFIQTLIIDPEFEKLGIDVSPEESGKLLYSEDAHETIKQYFSRDGEFSPSNVINYKNQVAKKDPKAMEQFELVIRQIIMEVQSRKYNSLIGKSIYATSLDAEDDYFAAAQNFSGKSVTVNFGTIDDKTIKFDDDDLKEYIKRHPEDFKQKASRDLEYILVSVTPSKADTLEVFEELKSDMTVFRDTDDDSAYVSLNSTEPFTGEYQSHGSYRKEIESILFNSPTDSVIGPFYYEGGYSIYKVLDKKQDSVFYYHAIKADLPIKGTTKQDTLAAMAAGRVLGAASNAAADPLEFFNSKMNTGEVTYAQDMGWQRDGNQTPEINEAVRKLSVGQYTVVQSVYGLSVIRLVEPKSSERIKVAEVRKMIEPLQSTQDAAYEKASNFRNMLTGNAKNEFEEMTKKAGLAKSVANNVKESDRNMTGIPNTLEVVRWAYGNDRKPGDYSDVISAGDMLIVAHLVRIKEEGIAELEDVREEVTRMLINEKKAEIITKQFNDAAAKGKSLEEIAQAVQSTVQPFFNINFYANSVQFAGNDTKLVGVVCGIKPKQISKPVVSNEGVHIFYVESTEKPELPKDLSSRKTAMFDQKKQQVYNMVFEALKKAANVKDERYKFY